MQLIWGKTPIVLEVLERQEFVPLIHSMHKDGWSTLKISM